MRKRTALLACLASLATCGACFAQNERTVALHDIKADGKVHAVTPFGSYKKPYACEFMYYHSAPSGDTLILLLGVIDRDKSHPRQMVQFSIARQPAKKPIEWYNAHASDSLVGPVGRKLLKAVDLAKKPVVKPGSTPTGKRKGKPISFILSEGQYNGSPNGMDLRVDPVDTAGDMYPVTLTIVEQGREGAFVFTDYRELNQFVGDYAQIEDWFSKQ